MNPLPPGLRFGARQSTIRLEDERLTTGSGRYTDDDAAVNDQWLVVLRSPHAHARIVSLDTEAALGMPGVSSVLTGADLVADQIGVLPTPKPFKRTGGAEMSVPPRRLLAHQTVRFVGEPVAALVAATRAQALDALEAIAVEYDPLPCVADLRDALSDDATAVWPDVPDNVVAATSYGDPNVVEAAFGQAAHRISLDLRNQRLVPMALEPRAAWAEVDPDGRLVLHAQTQTPATTRDILADAVLHRPKESIRVLVGDIGGGFGHKTNLFPEEALVALVAGRTGTRTRWRADRIDEFLGGTHGRDLATTAELALDERGRILAMRVKSFGNTGAYPTGTALLIPLLLGPFVATGIYDVQHVFLDVKAVMTNTAPMGAYRGAGRPEAQYIIERLMDAAARKTGIDPWTIRKINAVRPEQMPHKNAVGQVYDSGEFAAVLDRLAAIADADGYASRKAAAEARGKLYGRGVASYIEWTGGNTLQETATLFATTDGDLVLHSATQAMGQGLETAYAQMIASAFDVPIESVRVVQGDTDLARGMGSVGSRSMFVGGSAVAVTSADLLAKAREKAGKALEAATSDLEYAGGRFTIVGTDRSIGLFDLASDEQEGRLSVTSTATVDGPTWPNGAHLCEVSIDRDTGHVQVERYETVDDVGVPINPMLVHGQIHGGIAQGLGQALFEGAVYDAEGQLLTSSLMDYQIARADDMPDFDVTLFDGSSCRTNPLGAKGCGESGTVGATPTAVNAVIDALSPFGVFDVDMPLTPAKIWRAMQSSAGS